MTFRYAAICVIFISIITIWKTNNFHNEKSTLSARSIKISTKKQKLKQLHKIYNLPQPVFNEPDPIVVFDMHYIQNFASNIPAPDFTIISPSHNSGEILNFTAPAIFKTTLGIWEIVFLLDACSDGSLETLKRQIMNEFEMSTGWFY